MPHECCFAGHDFPDDAETSDAIPVLWPLGSALLGLSPGQTIDWKDGQDRRLTVVEIRPPTNGEATP